MRTWLRDNPNKAANAAAKINDPNDETQESESISGGVSLASSSRSETPKNNLSMKDMLSHLMAERFKRDVNLVELAEEMADSTD